MHIIICRHVNHSSLSQPHPPPPSHPPPLGHPCRPPHHGQRPPPHVPRLKSNSAEPNGGSNKPGPPRHCRYTHFRVRRSRSVGACASGVCDPYRLNPQPLIYSAQRGLFAVALLNKGSHPADITLQFNLLFPLPPSDLQTVLVRDVWSQTLLGAFPVQ